MKTTITFIVLLFTSGSVFASGSTLECKYKADPKSAIGVSVDESNSTQETVLMGINMTRPEGTIKSALLAKGSLAKQIARGVVIIPFSQDADPNASEIFDASLLAVTKNQKSGLFEGFLSIYDDGIAAMFISCRVN